MPKLDEDIIEGLEEFAFEEEVELDELIAGYQEQIAEIEAEDTEA